MTAKDVPMLMELENIWRRLRKYVPRYSRRDEYFKLAKGVAHLRNNIGDLNAPTLAGAHCP